MDNNPNQFDDDSFFDDEPLPDESALLERARELELEDKDEEAFGIVRRVLKTNSNNIDAIILYAQLVPDKQKAAQALQKAIRLDPNNIEAKRELKRLQKTAQVNKGKVDEFGSPSGSDDDSAVQQLLKQNQQLMQQMQQQPANQPVINIINENVNQNAGFATGEQRNQTAFIAGLIAGWVFGLLGVAHIVNGKIGQGIAYLFIGTFFYWVAWALVITLTVGIAACFLPLHFVAIWQHAKKGASYF